MTSKYRIRNKYVTNSHLTERKFRELLKSFCADITALSAADLTGLNRNTVNRYYGMQRERIADICEEQSPFEGEIEADESHFGAHRVRGRRGHGARGKTIVFGLLKRGDKVYAEIVPDVSRKTLMQVINEKVAKDPVMYTDGFRSYDGLVDWGYAKNRLVKYQGVRKEEFYYHLKECEFRFNMRGENLYKFMLKELRKRALNKLAPK